MNRLFLAVAALRLCVGGAFFPPVLLHPHGSRLPPRPTSMVSEGVRTPTAAAVLAAFSAGAVLLSTGSFVGTTLSQRETSKLQYQELRQEIRDQGSATRQQLHEVKEAMKDQGSATRQQLHEVKQETSRQFQEMKEQQRQTQKTVDNIVMVVYPFVGISAGVGLIGGAVNSKPGRNLIKLALQDGDKKEKPAKEIVGVNVVADDTKGSDTT